jgi:hypothetical protein
VIQVSGIEYCVTHGGIMAEGTDYHPDGLGCEYPERESDARCVGWPMYVHDATNPHASGNEDICPRCGDPTDPGWFCSEGYCPECCELDIDPEHAETHPD